MTDSNMAGMKINQEANDAGRTSFLVGINAGKTLAIQ